MKRRLLFIPVLIACCILIASCGLNSVRGKGETTSEDRPAGSFNSIEISATVVANIHVQEGAAPSVKLSGYKNLLKYIKTTTEGSTFKIGTTEPSLSFSTDKDVVADITVPSLKMLKLSGAASAKLNGGSSPRNLPSISAVPVKDGSKGYSPIISLLIFQGQENWRSAGGSAEKAKFSVSGAGDIHGFNLQANDAVAEVSGAGSIELTAQRTLEAEVSGAGDIKYKGAAKVHSSTSGAGSVTNAN